MQTMISRILLFNIEPPSNATQYFISTMKYAIHRYLGDIRRAVFKLVIFKSLLEKREKESSFTR
jgi:hypothetical protein